MAVVEIKVPAPSIHAAVRGTVASVSQTEVIPNLISTFERASAHLTLVRVAAVVTYSCRHHNVSPEEEDASKTDRIIHVYIHTYIYTYIPAYI